MAEMSCIKLVQNSQELVSSLRPYNTLNYKIHFETLHPVDPLTGSSLLGIQNSMLFICTVEPR